MVKTHEKRTPVKGKANDRGPIVIVSGDPENDSVFVDALQSHGYEIVVCRIPRRVLSLRDVKPRGWEPKIIIVDTIIPRESGFDLMKGITREYDPEITSFAMMSRYESAEDKSEATQLGARRIFLKPISSEMIEDFLEAERMRRLKSEISELVLRNT